MFVDSSREDRIPGLFRYWKGLPGQGGLVHIGKAGLNVAVHGNSFPGPHQERVTDPDLAGGEIFFQAVPADQGFLWGQG
ncbi:MAG: hypothetical protein BWY80_00298 [Firmicutes bacterium ADurb.Bin456]|nr:MAG: hypothetical protein BWY80_00298 [Firmicutes bacterium ADurb.Bin456]